MFIENDINLHLCYKSRAKLFALFLTSVFMTQKQIKIKIRTPTSLYCFSYLHCEHSLFIVYVLINVYYMQIANKIVAFLITALGSFQINL